MMTVLSIYRKNTSAQAATELAVFGAVLIFLLGSILRSAVSSAQQQNQQLKAMRQALIQSQNASVGRSVIDGSGFPDLEEGTLAIEEGGEVGEVLRGRFGVVFVTGTTLSGHFSSTLEEVSLQ